MIIIHVVPLNDRVCLGYRVERDPEVHGPSDCGTPRGLVFGRDSADALKAAWLAWGEDVPALIFTRPAVRP